MYFSFHQVSGRRLRSLSRSRPSATCTPFAPSPLSLRSLSLSLARALSLSLAVSLSFSFTLSRARSFSLSLSLSLYFSLYLSLWPSLCTPSVSSPSPRSVAELSEFILTPKGDGVASQNRYSASVLLIFRRRPPPPLDLFNCNVTEQSRTLSSDFNLGTRASTRNVHQPLLFFLITLEPGVE